MLVKTIPLPRDAESRGPDWPAAGEPTAAELAAIETDLPPLDDAIDWERLAAEVAAELAGPRRAADVRDLAEMATGDLVELASEGMTEAFGQLFARLSPQMIRVAHRRLFWDADSAQDLVSDVWIHVIATAGRWDRRDGNPETDFRRMVFGMLRTKIARHQADHWREVQAEVEEWMADRPIRPVGMPEDDDTGVSTARVEMLGKLHDGIVALSPRQRDAIRLKLNGLTGAEVAARAGLTVAQVHKLWATAEQTLRNNLTDPLADADPARVREAVAVLAEPYREVMQLRSQGLSQGEIGKRIGRDGPATWRLIRTARENIRRILLEPKAAGLGDLDAARERREARRSQLREAAQALPAGQREVALMRIDGMRQTDIVKALGRDVKSVGSAWRRAKDSLERAGLVIDDPLRGSHSRLNLTQAA